MLTEVSPGRRVNFAKTPIYQVRKNLSLSLSLSLCFSNMHNLYMYMYRDTSTYVRILHTYTRTQTNKKRAHTRSVWHLHRRGPTWPSTRPGVDSAMNRLHGEGLHIGMEQYLGSVR